MYLYCLPITSIDQAWKAQEETDLIVSGGLYLTIIFPICIVPMLERIIFIGKFCGRNKIWSYFRLLYSSKNGVGFGFWGFFWSCFFKAGTICTHYKSRSPFLQGKVQIICSLPVILVFTWLKFSYSFAKVMMLNESSISPASFSWRLPASAKKTLHLISCSMSRQHKEDEVERISKWWKKAKKCSHCCGNMNSIARC